MAHGAPITMAVMAQTAASIRLSSVKPLCRVLADFARVIRFRLATASNHAVDIGADLGNIYPCSTLITLSWGKRGCSEWVEREITDVSRQRGMKYGNSEYDPSFRNNIHRSYPLSHSSAC